jgi:hypothetical protein
MLGNRCNRLDDSQSATICPILAAKPAGIQASAVLPESGSAP